MKEISLDCLLAVHLCIWLWSKWEGNCVKGPGGAYWSILQVHTHWRHWTYWTHTVDTDSGDANLLASPRHRRQLLDGLKGHMQHWWKLVLLLFTTHTNYYCFSDLSIFPNSFRRKTVKFLLWPWHLYSHKSRIIWVYESRFALGSPSKSLIYSSAGWYFTTSI